MTQNETTLKILECAKNDFLQNGYQGVSLKEICRHAGVTTGALYHRFSGKLNCINLLWNLFRKITGIIKKSAGRYSILIMPEPCLAFVYLHLDIFKIIIRCKCTAYYSKFYSVIEENIYHRILEASNNYEKGICRLLSKAYVASLFEIIYCNYDFETARKCISAMERFFVPQGISC